MQVIWKRLYAISSSAEKGTLLQLRNLINFKHPTSSPKSNFSACLDLLNIIVESHVVAAALKVFQTTSTSQQPNEDILPHDLWTQDDHIRRDKMYEICLKIFDRFVGRFQMNLEDTGLTESDGKYSYACEVLNLGLFFTEFHDSIKEADGNRILRCYRYLLPLFKSSNRKNYALEAYNLLYAYHYSLSKRQAAQLIWSRTINVQGIKGKNIPMDLHLEHLNRTVKEAVQTLGSNKTEQAMVRIGKSLGTLSPALETFDRINDVPAPYGTHTIPDISAECSRIVEQLISEDVFTLKNSIRYHKSFKKMNGCLLHEVNKEELLSWMINHTPSH